MISSFDAKEVVALGSLHFFEKLKPSKSYYIFENRKRKIDYKLHVAKKLWWFL